MTFLVGLQHNCARVCYYCKAIETLTDRPVTVSRVKSDPSVESKHIRFRDDLYTFIADAEWSWIQPRVRWIVDPE